MGRLIKLTLLAILLLGCATAVPVMPNDHQLLPAPPPPKRIVVTTGDCKGNERGYWFPLTTDDGIHLLLTRTLDDPDTTICAVPWDRRIFVDFKAKET